MAANQENKYIVIDGIKWFVYSTQQGVRMLQPLCPQHHLRLKPIPSGNAYERDARTLQCAEGFHLLNIPRRFDDEKKYVIDRIDAQVFAQQTFIYLDDMAIPVASEELKDKDSPVWVKTKVTESKSGLRLLVWAGVRGDKTKTQLFVEPGIKRLSFDQNDDHPTKVFAKVEATFVDGLTASIKSKKE